jgi:hypothetical protein
VSHHALGCGDGEDCWHVEQTDSFYVNWPAEFVRLVITVWVVLLNLIILAEVEGLDNLIDALSLAPINEVLEHHHHLREIEFACAAESEVVVVIIVRHIAYLRSLDPLFELF